jgi:DNA transposition AAA+ family ATPase
MITDKQSGGAAAESQIDTPVLNTSGGWNIPGDVVAAGIAKYDPKYHDDLHFGYEHARAQGWSMREAADNYFIDTSTLSRVYRGEYKSPGTSLMLPPPAALLSVIRETRENLREAVHTKKVRVMTPTVKNIWDLCHMAWQDRAIGFLYGFSHLGKTEALEWFRDENNHGKTVYVDLQHAQGVHGLYKQFAVALRLSVDCGSEKLARRIISALRPAGTPFSRRFVILDEFHSITHSYQKNSAIKMINAIKAIKDAAKCGMVICGTDVAREEMTDENESHDFKFLQQIRRRGILELNLAKAIPVGDVRAIAAHYNLPFPTYASICAKVEKMPGCSIEKLLRGKTRIADDWKNLQLAFNDEQFTCLDEIAWHFGIERLFKQFQHAAIIAKKRGKPIGWEHFINAHDIYFKFKTPVAV